MGIWCLHASSFIFDRIIIKVLVTRTGIKARTSSISGLWFPWLIYMFFICFLNEIWPWHIGLRWAIVALWATCSWLFLIRSFWYLQVMIACTKAWMSLNFALDLTSNYGVSQHSLSKNIDAATFPGLLLIGSIFFKWDLTLTHWTQVSDRWPLGYLFSLAHRLFFIFLISRSHLGWLLQF